ncbi:MAG: UbiA family prenyltransferase [Candidatus Omnitrophica bacterium]|nr:UbiA family prenyltransferase [Candidatus Omnitrophota bacterium]
MKTYARFIKLEHAVFSLPLIYAGAWLGAGGPPSARVAGLILLAAIGGRVMAMGLNRLIDAAIDARNPRTKNRELPSGAMRPAEAWVIVGLAGLLYAGSAAAIAPVCLAWSPLPVALFVLYPYLKRFTALSHLGLGLAWSMAPLGGWLAAAQSFASFSDVAWLWLFSVVWVAGFDVIYATMDEAFDRKEGLHSLPARAGKASALRIAALLHAAAFMALVILQRDVLRSSIGLPWLLAIAAILIWEHAVAPREPEFAFFHLNAVIGFLVFGFVLLSGG